MALSYNNLGLLLDKIGSNEEAKEFLLKALKIREEVYKENSNHSDFKFKLS